ncbi:MAG: four helix bundle protein [Candidatus Margulisiibacteriota bacterium]|nr:four helix bundle protein [Candidatus Margulisiibacteriota bacterium]
MTNKIRNFTDLEVWKLGHEFVLDIYKIIKQFPKREMYGITSQLCRSSVSITSNIAEGFSRYHFKDKIRFYYNARGSVSESQNHIIIARDVGYLDGEISQNLIFRINKITQMLNGLIRSAQNQL